MEGLEKGGRSDFFENEMKEGGGTHIGGREVQKAVERDEKEKKWADEKNQEFWTYCQSRGGRSNAMTKLSSREKG